MSRKNNIQLTKGRIIAASDLHLQFIQSSGPGGQNVNKVATKVHLKVPLSALQKVLHPSEYTRLEKKLKNRIDQDEHIYLQCNETRHQHKNREIALQRMEKLLRDAIRIPKKRKATKPTRSSMEKRLKTKKIRAEKKKNRAKID